MSILNFTQVFAKELPSIEKSLEAHLNTLPSVVMPIIKHTAKAGGKRLRPLLTLLCAKLFISKEHKLDNEIYSLASCLEMIHLASLLHDDVIDNADTRRNKPTAHTIFGASSTILAGDALLGYACEHMASYNCPELFSLYAQAVMQTTKGELEEIAMQGSLAHGDEKYYEIISGKTAYLLRSACTMGALYMQKVKNLPISQEEIEAIGQYGEELGMAFQLIDDALDFAPEEQIGKPQGGDIREGKATIPVLAYYHSLSKEDAKIFEEKFKAAGSENEFTQEEVSTISQIILDKKFDELARLKALEHLDKAKACLDIFQKSQAKDILLSALDYLSKRNT